MQEAQSKFPWKIFLRVFVLYVIALSIFVFLTNHPETNRTWILVSSVALSALFIAYDTAKPLQRVIEQIHVKHWPMEQLSSEAYGEWSELESNVQLIKKKLENTSINLTMEQIELDTLLGAISDAVLAVDMEENPLFYNSRLEMILSGKKFNRQSKLWELFRVPEILTSYKKALEEGKVWTTSAMLFQIAPQSKRYYILSVSPLRKQDEKIYGALGIFHDVTDLKTAEQMRIDFVANVSHELRTPLTSIKGYIETLIADAKKDLKLLATEETKTHLETIQRNSARLMNLMSDLLDLSSIESSDVLHKEWLATADVTDKAYKQVEDKMKAKSHTFDISIQTEKVFADPVRLEQVLVNLLDNACKYSPPGGRISVLWKAKDKDIILKVSDTGPGIPLDAQPRIFERFYRIDKARSRDQGGTGLGLAIVKHIMQRHEGAIWVESTPGQGSSFHCRFPVQTLS